MATYAVTGSASGIGAALTAKLTEQQHAVIQVDISKGDVIADLSTAAGREAAIAGIRALAPNGLDGLVPLAGVSAPPAPPERIISINYFGVIELLAGLRDLLGKSTGTTVLIGSNSAPMSSTEDPLLAPLLDCDEASALALSAEHNNGLQYMTAKRALIYWMRRNAMIYAREGIRMNAIAPGPVDTPMTKPLYDDPNMVAVLEHMMDATPLARAAKPEEIADVIAFLLSDQARYLCGSVLYADGGYDANTRSDWL